jgi:hypothetical protein
MQFAYIYTSPSSAILLTIRVSAMKDYENAAVELDDDMIDLGEISVETEGGLGSTAEGAPQQSLRD